MTNYEHLMLISKKDLVAFICNQQGDCDCCVARDMCEVGHTGLLDWMDMEYKGEQYAIQETE